MTAGQLIDHAHSMHPKQLSLTFLKFLSPKLSLIVATEIRVLILRMLVSVFSPTIMAGPRFVAVAARLVCVYGSSVSSVTLDLRNQ